MSYRNLRTWLVVIAASLCPALALQEDAINLVSDYFQHKGAKHVVYLSCERQLQNNRIMKHLMTNVGMVSMGLMQRDQCNLGTLLHQWNIPVGVLVDGSCDHTQHILDEASRRKLLGATHMWLVVAGGAGAGSAMSYIDDKFTFLNLSVDADIVVAHRDGLNIWLKEFKYYNRLDFHNLTLRAVTVILNPPKVFHPELVSAVEYTPGITSSLTKTAVQMLDVLKQQHNFRFNYTIVDRWVGEPQRNSTPAVTNTIFWGEQDLSYTSMRIFPKWVQWVEPFFPPVAYQETKFYYLMLDRGIGEYENRFIQPLSLGAWACSSAAAALSALALCACAAAEHRPQPALYALCSVFAAVCQQAFEDGVQIVQNAFSSQGRRMALATAGVASMLLYNYYTSSVVSWLLSAAPPALASLDALAASRLQLVFEDVGYTRSWLDYPGFYYYSGFNNPIEDELRDKKVTKAKRTVPLLFQSTADAVELIRSGEYAYHSEPYSASRELARRLDERELCQLAALQMMRPFHAYIVGQRRSPYKQFFDWSLLRLMERGHLTVLSARVRAPALSCSGRTPRALSLGQAAPAFALLAQAAVLALVVLAAEILTHRAKMNRLP